MGTLQLSLFGMPRTHVAGAPIPISLDKALALLAYLAVTRTGHRRDLLAAMLWPETDQVHARAYLRNALYVLTKQCGDDCFQSDRQSIALADAPTVQVDVVHFGEAIDAAQAATQQANEIAALTRAADIAVAPFMAGFSLPDAPEFDEWQRFERASLERTLETALQKLVAYHHAQQDDQTAICYAQRWVALDPLDEQPQRMLMQLFALAGQKADALRQYAEMTRRLDEELGVPPSDATDALYDAIQAGQLTTPLSDPAPIPFALARNGHPPVTVSPPDATAQSTADQAPFDNLPQPLTPFVGREVELIELERMLENPDVRLITIVGPGGMGKTRLALACSARQVAQGRFRDGVAFVSLAPVTDPAHVAATVAATLGYALPSGAPHTRTVAEQVMEHLQGKEMLLVLDNFEHLLEATAFVVALLQAAPGVRVLVTSREWLHAKAEHVFPIMGLTHGDPSATEQVEETDAIHLFRRTAQRIAPGLTLTGKDLHHVAEICYLVEGMPLGIELAAAWSDLLSPAEIAAEIRRNLAFLATDARDAPARHHSVRAAFDATWQRLDAPEQDAFVALSVFHGGFTREAAREVAGITLHQLHTLVGKSMVQPDRRQTNRHNRYGMHELLRQYGALKLAQSPATHADVQARHAAYFAAFLEARLGPINGPQQRSVADDIHAEWDNIRAVWRWALDHRHMTTLHQSATTLFLFCQLRSHFREGTEMMAAAAACLANVTPSRLRDTTLAQVLNHEGWLRIRLGEFERATAVLEQSRSLYSRSDLPDPAPYMGTDPAPALAIIAAIRGDHATALALGQEALDAARRRADPYNQCHAHYVLTSAHAARGDYTVATHHARQACSLAEAAGNQFFLAVLLDEWGKVARAKGDYAQARQHFQASYTIKRAFNEPEGMAVALNHLGQLAILQHTPDEAETLYQQAYALYTDIGDRVGLATALRGLAQVACARQDDAAARHDFAQALTIATETAFLPLLFAILIDLGDQLVRHDRPILGVRALACVRQHPAADRETKNRAASSLARWRSHVDAQDYDDARRQVQESDWRAVVDAMQTVLTNPTRPEEPHPRTRRPTLC